MRNRATCDMTFINTTTTALLDALRDPAQATVWTTFDTRYRPIILGVARNLGLDEHDAADVAQEALTQFLKDYRAGKYQRGRGRLRSWIIGIVKHRVADVRRDRVRRRELHGESVIAALPADDALEQLWDAEQRAAVLRDAFAELRRGTRTSDDSLRAFERLCFDQRPAADVAAELGMTTHDVYMAKNRVMDRLRAIAARHEALYVDGM